MFVAAIADLYLKIKTSVSGCFISYPKFRTKTALEKKELNQSQFGLTICLFHCVRLFDRLYVLHVVNYRNSSPTKNTFSSYFVR
jgi:hypothetical protein